MESAQHDVVPASHERVRPVIEKDAVLRPEPAVRPYTIELVPVDRGWILEKIAEEIARAAARKPERYRVDVTTHPSGNAELTLFLPESAWRDDLQDTIRVTYLAHKEDHPEAAALFEEVARKSDCCITSSSKYAEILRADGAREVFTIPLGVDTEAFVPKIRIGVVGRTYHTGRKGESLLARSLDVPFVEFVFTGEGWPLPARYYDEPDLVQFYQSLDYLLIPSLIEGGPVPMLEALATGCRVIAPSDVGMVGDFPHIPFRRGDAEDLRRVLQIEVDQRLALRAAALPCDWQHFAERHLQLFAQLIDRRRVRTDGMSAAAAPRGTRCHVLLMTHGPEEVARGGPTTRVQNIVSHLRARGLPVESARDVRAIASNRYDIIHVFNSWPPDSALATLTAARRTGAKVVFSPIALDLADWPLFHPFLEKLFQSGPTDESLRAALSAIRASTPRRRYEGQGADMPIEGLPGLFEKLRLCCDLADRLVLLSEYERAYLAAIGARVDHGIIIRNGVDVEAMAGADAALFKARFGVERYLLCVGRIEYRKNQAVAAIAARNAGADFVLIGAPGDSGYVEHVRRMGGPKVRIVDRIEDRRMLASAYAGAAAFLFPSWTEGAPLAAMEAAAAGAPLVLGDMSSEREHFADDAHYVHPADLTAMQKAVTQALAHPDDTATRLARARRFSSAFSIARHADETWALYEQLDATTPSVPPLVADVSALLHFVRVRQPFTGVPLVEHEILHRLADIDPSLRTIVYNDVKGRFIEIGLADLESFDDERFNAQHWFRPDEHGLRDRRAVMRFTDRTTPALPIAPPDESEPTPALRTRAIAFGKRAMQRMPRSIRDPAVVLLQRLRPGFDPLRMPPGYLQRPSIAMTRKQPMRSSASEPSKTETLRFEHPLGSVFVQAVPREVPMVPVGARLLTLGQSWLSNGPLLDEMIRLAESRALSLEPYVYDLTYHTGAHQTGWNDNDERFARLLQLLRYSSVVFTESRQVEQQLQKLRASRGLAYRTCRTGLRGRDFSSNDPPRHAARYRRDSFVLCVSSFNRRKNHDFLIRVWLDLHETWIRPAGRDFRLVLAGQVQEEQKYADPAFVARLKRSNIDVCTDLPDRALARLMADCAFTAYPSLQEGWGLPAQESLMCGKVCLVSSTLPVAQEIANPALIRLAPDDFYGWHEALRTWLENAPMRHAFAERAREYSPPTWQEIAETIASAPT